MELQSTFQQWFTLLIKYRLPGAAVGLAGIAVGLPIIFSTAELYDPAKDDVLYLGLALMGGQLSSFFSPAFSRSLVQLSEFARADADSDRGGGVPHQEVKDWVNSWGRKRERSAPNHAAT